jgi:ribonucleoside-diphosphate reductase beta chain
MSGDPTAGGIRAHFAPLTYIEEWEEKQWSIGELELARDRPGWQQLPGFVAAGIRTAIDQFFLGESAVTETLAPIAHTAPDAESRLFICTQLADEARHTLFFLKYLDAIGDIQDGLSGTDVSHYTSKRWDAAPEHLRTLLDQDLRLVTDQLGRGDDVCCWYRAVTLYHLLIEGVSAVAGQRTLLDATRQYQGLAMLHSGLQRIARDESRHINFGVGALRRGVGAGFGDAIAEQLLLSVGMSAWSVVGPDRALPPLMSVAVLRRVANSVQRSLTLARGALLGRVERIGLSDVLPSVVNAWEEAVEAALEHYCEIHGRAHPLRHVSQAAIR